MPRLLGFENGSSDKALWGRLRQELPEWVFSGVIPPLTIHRLEECLGVLDPTKRAAATTTKRVRADMHAVLDDLYHLLIGTDAITRMVRQLRHIWLVRGQVGFPRWERGVLAGVAVVAIVEFAVVAL